MNRLLFLLATGLLGLAGHAQSTATWVATDGLGRTMPSAQEAPLKRDGKPRTVGIFYITWHTQGLHNGAEYKCDVSRVLDQDPNARNEWDNKAWTGASYHWGEPEYGYFLSRDKYVVRHDLSMLADAGVDVLIMDVTNAVFYWDEWEVLFSTMQEMKKQGNRVPKFCFWAFNGNAISVVQTLYERFYKTPRYQDCWFYWDGKPLLLYNATPSFDSTPNGGSKDVADYSDEVKQFFTLRNMWWGYYKWGGKRYVGQEDCWSFGYDLHEENVKALTPEQLCAPHQGRKEQMAVTPAQHPLSIVGKCWRRDVGEPELDDHDMPASAYCPAVDSVVQNPTQYGIYFQDRWNEALQVDPEFIYLNDWNEWTAGKYPANSFLGRKSNFMFVDQYNAEFNRTISPMKGGYTDNYYMQTVQNIRRYKGVRPIPEGKGVKQIELGDFDAWKAVTPTYYDTKGDVTHRDFAGYSGLHYTDNSGRNDIAYSKVAFDGENVLFYVETTGNLTPSTDPNWMLLLIDADQNHSTGWNGYDYIVNKQVKDGSTTTLMRWGGKSWKKCADVKYSVNGNKLVISIPMKALKLGGDKVSFDFHWSDNPKSLDDIISLCTTGDNAPNRRFNYRCIWSK